MTARVRWLDRKAILTPHVTLCLTEAAFLKAAKQCRINSPGEWLDVAKNVACVHTWVVGGDLTCVVCLHPDAMQVDPIEVAGTFVHEAVHIWQRMCDRIGETEPSREFEAHTIDRLSMNLMREFVRQTKG